MIPTLPNTEFAEIEIASVFPSVRTTADSGKTLRLAFPSHYYKLQVNYPTLTSKQAKQLTGFLAAQRGSLGRFKVTVADYSYGDGELAKLQRSNSAYTVRVINRTIVDNQVTLQYNLQLNNSSSNLGNPMIDPFEDYLCVGDYISFTANPGYPAAVAPTKVYQVVDNVNSLNILGAGTCVVAPVNNFLTGNDGTQVDVKFDIVVNDVSWVVYLEEPEIVMSGGLAGTASIVLNLTEDI